PDFRHRAAPRIPSMKLLRASVLVLLCGLASFQANAGLAPDPETTKEAVVQVYGARTMGVKGLFGVHTWIAVKPTDAAHWTVYEIIGWRLRWSDRALLTPGRQPARPRVGPRRPT